MILRRGIDKNIMKDYLKEYCVGCGLCEALNKAECKTDENGFLHPISGDESWLERVCPSGGKQCDAMSKFNIWGRYKSVYYGWSSDNATRKLASSGGVLSETAAWLLEQGLVDAVIHTCADPNDPTKTISCFSTTRQEVVERSGSRYAISHPLEVIASLEREKKYVFVGKPCDVTALKNYMELQPDLQNCIVYTLSFFCAGLPSEAAQSKLLAHLGCDNDTVESLRYRGDGWPGYTTAVTKDHQQHRTDYATAWGRILGRDIMKMCRFCLDGIGESADISCGDAWFVDENHKPIFSEGKGRNVIFARTEKGKLLLESMIAEGKIAVEPAPLEELPQIQAYQQDRRATMIGKILALSISGRATPRYRLRSLLGYSKAVPLGKHLKIMLGTLKRIWNGKI